MKLLPVILFYFVISVSSAQSPNQVLEWMNTVTSNAKDFYYEIPFEYRNGEIVIEVQIGSEKYNYIFDTGGYNNITDAIQAKNDFPVITKQTVGSANKLKASVNMVKVDTVGIGKLMFTDVAMLQMDYSKVPTIGCSINGGLIGASIIKKYIWRINYATKTIIITDKKSNFPDLNTSVKVPVTFDKRLMPYIEIEIDRHKEKMLFDLGSSTAFSLTMKSARQYGRFKNAVSILGGGTEGGNGFVKQKVIFFKAGEIKIGNFKYIDRPVLSAETNNIDLIGNPIIKDFIVTLNFPENEMYLSPITEISKGWQNFGFSLGYKDDKIKVITLYEGFAAQKAGLRVDDEISAIDGRPIDCSNFCECLERLPVLLSSRQKLTLTIVRNNQKTDITLQKEMIF